MAIPANIISDLTFVQSQVVAAGSPITNAPFATIKAIQLNAGNLVNDIQTALTATSLLDTWVAPVPVTVSTVLFSSDSLVNPTSILGGFAAVVTAAQDQNNLALMRSVAGRAASNLDQLV